jgi:hypothetical protein
MSPGASPPERGVFFFASPFGRGRRAAPGEGKERRASESAREPGGRYLSDLGGRSKISRWPRAATDLDDGGGADGGQLHLGCRQPAYRDRAGHQLRAPILCTANRRTRLTLPNGIVVTYTGAGPERGRRDGLKPVEELDGRVRPT